MAFQTPNNANVSPFPGQAPAQAGQNDKWKSDAFINLYLPTESGERRKIGSIGLKLSKPLEKQLLDYLADNGEEGLANLKEKIELDFKRADGQNGAALAL